MPSCCSAQTEEQFITEHGFDPHEKLLEWRDEPLDPRLRKKLKVPSNLQETAAPKKGDAGGDAGKKKK